MNRRITIVPKLLCLLLSVAMWNVGNGANAKSGLVEPALPMAPFLVTNTGDMGAGSLRQAIAGANLAAGADTIMFDTAGVFATPQTITLTSGEIVITDDLTITGTGVSNLTISGGNSSRIFFINPGAAGATAAPVPPFPVVNISDLTIANGRAKGGDGGTGPGGGGGGGAAGMGGAIFVNGGTVTIERVTLQDNLALGGNGGNKANMGPTAGGGGGGVGSNGATNSGINGGNGGNGGSLGGSGGGSGSNGGEGGGGGGGSACSCPAIGNGGFGGGGGGFSQFTPVAGKGGFGGGGGGGGGVGGLFGGTPSILGGGGGGGAGLGGAVFVRLGSLNLLNSTLNTNVATGGSAGSGGVALVGQGKGKGGALFIDTGATANACSTTFSGNTASDDAGTVIDSNDLYGSLSATGCDVAPSFTDCPDNINDTNDPGLCTASVTFAPAASGSPTPTIECKIGSMVITSPYNFPVGTTTVNCTASNRAGSDECSFTVTVADSEKPVVDCQAVAAQSADANANCEATVPDVRGLVRAQSSDNCTPQASLVVTQVPAAGSSVSGVGSHPIAVTVCDTASPTANCVQCSVPFTVNDASPPVIGAVTVDKPILEPPNHRMVDVTVNYSVTDNCSSATCVLSVTSNEPGNGLGDGDTSPDWAVIDPHKVRLRAERSGNGKGRTYTITVTCTDAAGKIATRTVTVAVPHEGT